MLRENAEHGAAGQVAEISAVGNMLQKKAEQRAAGQVAEKS